MQVTSEYMISLIFQTDHIMLYLFRYSNVLLYKICMEENQYDIEGEYFPLKNLYHPKIFAFCFSFLIFYAFFLFSIFFFIV